MKLLIVDLIKFQTQVPVIPKNSFNPHFKSYFADLATVVDICKPVLNKNNLCVIQRLGTQEGKNVLVTMLYHQSGEFIDASIFLPEIVDAQKLTAAITYLRRTSYLSILGLVADDDTDGNNIPGTQPPKDNTYQPKVSTIQPSFATTSTPASEAQKGAMRKMGIVFKETISKADASKMIETYNKER